MSTASNILLVSSRIEALRNFADGLRSETQNTVISVSTVQEAIEAVMRIVPVMAVIDHEVGDISGLDIVRRILKINAFIHTAVISDMEHEAFHEQSEGLGIVAQLPSAPGAQEARQLLSLLHDLMPS